MKRLQVLLAAAFGLLLSACGSDSTTPPPASFPRPAGYIAVTISVDDTANKVFANNELGWKGNMKFQGETNRIITKPDNWDGPFANLYDDGPWDQGGHEAPGEVAGDHKFGATVFIQPPPAGGTNTVVAYGMIDNVYEKNYGNGWIWPAGPNGQFVIVPGQTTDVKASGMTLPAHGTIDFQLKLDRTALTPPDSGAWATNTVKVKGSATSWSEVDVTSSLSGGVYTFTLSDVVGPKPKPFYHSGLLKSGDAPEWIWVLGGTEYKATNAGTNTLEAATGGVTAYIRPSGGSWTSQTVGHAGNHNTNITVP